VVILGVGAAFYVRQQRAARPSVEATPLAAAAPAPTLPRNTEEVVQINSTPPGAEVTDGPKLLGTTPFDLRITDKRPTVEVKLVKSGFDDLLYKVSANDVPSITLKLKKRHGSSDGKGLSNKAPKVESFDDAETKGAL